MGLGTGMSSLCQSNLMMMMIDHLPLITILFLFFWLLCISFRVRKRAHLQGGLERSIEQRRRGLRICRANCITYSHLPSCPYACEMSHHVVMTQYSYTSSTSIPRPPMIPPLPPRKIRLQPRILHRHTPPHAPLNHRTPIQSSHLPTLHTQPTRIRALPTSLLFTNPVAVSVQQAQVLARRAHTHVLALELAFLGRAPLAQEEHPGAVDGPVAQEAVAGEVEWARGERVGKVVAD
jgi:hypothetical protein